MQLSGLHLLLTYRCILECDHCFVWGGPRQNSTMGLSDIREILRQAIDLKTIDWIYFEGGEPFLYYSVLRRGVTEAARAGFQVGIVTNGYWATSLEDALECLRPFAGMVQDLSVSSDFYHWDEKFSQQAKNTVLAADRLGIPVGVISIAQPERMEVPSADRQLSLGESVVKFRGRAAEKLVTRASRHRPWEELRECPYEDLENPGRVHVDPSGNVHICQGISLGNLFHTPLGEICRTYEAGSHPITAPLLRGGPAELVRCFELSQKENYADACQLCYESRLALREKFPEILAPDQMYGVPEPPSRKSDPQGP